MDLHTIDEHESPVRRITAASYGCTYESVRSLDEARKLTDYAVVMEGDYGGQIYLTCPVSLIACDQVVLHQLLEDIDSIQMDNRSGLGLYFERAPVGSGIAGGMGGAGISYALWVHEELRLIGMETAVKAVIDGHQNRLAIPTCDQLNKLANDGNDKAQYFIGERLGRTHSQNARDWYTKAAEQGHPGALHRLALNSELSPQERAKWLRVIVDKNDDTDRRIDWMRIMLARAYETGHGIAKDLAAAAALYEKVCDNRSYAVAAKCLGEMYLHGNGVVSDKKLGLMWLILADVDSIRKPPYWRCILTIQAQRDQHSELVQQVKQSMTIDEVAMSEQMARDMCSP